MTVRQVTYRAVSAGLVDNWGRVYLGRRSKARRNRRRASSSSGRTCRSRCRRASSMSRRTASKASRGTSMAAGLADRARQVQPARFDKGVLAQVSKTDDAPGFHARAAAAALARFLAQDDEASAKELATCCAPRNYRHWSRPAPNCLRSSPSHCARTYTRSSRGSIGRTISPSTAATKTGRTRH